MPNKKTTLKIPVHPENLASLESMAGKIGLGLSDFVGLLVNSLAIASASLTGEPIPAEAAPVVKKTAKRGPRAKKQDAPAADPAVPPVPKKRGRPKKVVDVNASPAAVPKKRGRPRKVVVAAEAAPVAETAAPVVKKTRTRKAKQASDDAVPAVPAAEPKKRAKRAPKKETASEKPAKKTRKRAPRTKKAAVEAPPAELA